MNKMPLTIFNSNFGIMEDENGGSPMHWANCQTVGDFQENGDKVGCQVGKISVVTDNHFALSKRLNIELSAKKAPLDVLAVLGMGVSNGKSTFILKDFEVSKGS